MRQIAAVIRKFTSKTDDLWLRRRLEDFEYGDMAYRRDYTYIFVYTITIILLFENNHDNRIILLFLYIHEYIIVHIAECTPTSQLLLPPTPLPPINFKFRVGNR